MPLEVPGAGCIGVKLKDIHISGGTSGVGARPAVRCSPLRRVVVVANFRVSNLGLEIARCGHALVC